MSIVAGSALHLRPTPFMLLAQSRMASPSGRCATYSADADGYAPGEAVVVMVL